MTIWVDEDYNAVSIPPIKKSCWYNKLIKYKKMEEKMINLGDKVRDKVTGYEGTATCRVEWLFGCVRVGVQGKVQKDGKPIEVQYFDEASLEVRGKTKSKAKGGGADDKSRRDERR